MAEVHADRASRGKEVLGVGDVARSLTRIAYEIVERNGGSDNLVIAGIPTRGATLARRLVNRIREVSGTYAELAIIDTTMYRDDLASQPLRAPKETLVPRTGINGKTVVLVDDVLYTGLSPEGRHRARLFRRAEWSRFRRGRSAGSCRRSPGESEAREGHGRPGLRAERPQGDRYE